MLHTELSRDILFFENILKNYKQNEYYTKLQLEAFILKLKQEFITSKL
jgi:hypothetical protein